MKKIFLWIGLFLIFIFGVFLFIMLKSTKTNNFKNGEIKIFCWGQYISDGTDNSLNILETFEKEENIKVAAFNTFDSCEQMYAKLKNGNSNYDIIFTSDYMVKRLIDENLIQKIDKSKLKNYKNIMDSCKGSFWGFDKYDMYSVPYSWGHVAIIYNEPYINQLTGKDAKSVVTGLDALWDRRLKQEILMFIGSRDSFSIAQKILKNSINTTNEKHIHRAAKLLKNQKKLIQAYVMDEMFDKMENNEAAISLAYSGDIMKMMENNKNLRYCFPKEGTNVFIDTVCIPSNAKNVNNALKFIDFLCKDYIAKANAEFSSYSTPNKAAWALLDDNIKNNKIAYPDKETLKKCEVHLPLPKKLNELIETLWANIRT